MLVVATEYNRRADLFKEIQPGIYVRLVRFGFVAVAFCTCPPTGCIRPVAKVEYEPRMEGRQMIMILAPK